MLMERNYHAGSSKDKRKLAGCLLRTDLGLISYVNETNDELRALLSKRNSHEYFGNHKGTREELIWALEREDYNRRFKHFTRLPAELRVCK